MLYLSQMLGKPVFDASGDEIGHIKDVAIATREIFPRVTSLAFVGPDKTPFMLSWRKFVEGFDGETIRLTATGPELRFSYLQPDEVLLARDLLNKQIVDTQGMKVVRVNDLKLSESKNQLRLLGAEVGARGILRSLSPALERGTQTILKALGRTLPETIIAWNYMDLLDRDLSQVKLSVTHKRLHELHPADVADILEQLSPSQRAKVFTHLDNTQAAETISELEDEFQADVIEDLAEGRASDILEMMDPDDAADIIGDLPYDKAEQLLRLMGVRESGAVRHLLGYKEHTAGGIMTPEVTTVTEDMTVQHVIDHLRTEAAEHESIYYIYVVDDSGRLDGVISLRDLIMSAPETLVSEIAERDLFTVGPDDDQEEVADLMSKYDLLAMPVMDETGTLLGMVTVDDALDVMEEESAEDLALATGSSRGPGVDMIGWLVRRNLWLLVWAAVVFAVGQLTRGDAGGFSLLFFLPPLLFLPIVLRVSEDVAQRGIAEMINEGDEGERPSVGWHIARDAVSGAGLGLVVGLLVFGVTELYSRDPAIAGAFGVATGLTVLVMMVLGVAVTAWTRRLAEHDRRVSGTALGALMMTVGVVVYGILVIAAESVAVRFMAG